MKFNVHYRYSRPSIILTYLPLSSLFLYSISKPDKHGVPSYDLSGDSDAKPVYHNGVQTKPDYAVATKIDRVLTKAVVEVLT